MKEYQKPFVWVIGSVPHDVVTLSAGTATTSFGMNYEGDFFNLERFENTKGGNV